MTQRQRRQRLGRIYLDYVTIPGATMREVADKYGVCHQRIHFVINRVDEQLNECYHTGSYRHWRDDLTKKQVAKLRALVSLWAKGD